MIKEDDLMKKKKGLIAALCAVVAIVAVVCGILLSGGEDTELPLYEADSYSEMKSILSEADGTFTLPDESCMDDYSYGLRRIMLDQPGGKPIGYFLCGYDLPGDHYLKEISIECALVTNGNADSELLEEYEGVELYADSEGIVRFYLNGAAYTINSDISSTQGGFQGKEPEQQEAMRFAKNIIDMAQLQE